jgi:hypothetical protein
VSRQIGHGLESLSGIVVQIQIQIQIQTLTANLIPNIIKETTASGIGFRATIRGELSSPVHCHTS